MSDSESSDGFDAEDLEKELRLGAAAEKAPAAGPSEAVRRVVSGWTSRALEQRDPPSATKKRKVAFAPSPSSLLITHEEQPESDAKTIYVGNLAATASQGLLGQFVAEEVGREVRSIRIVDKGDRRFGFVEFEAAADARRAVDLIDGADFCDRRLVVSLAEQPKQHLSAGDRRRADKELLAAQVDKAQLERERQGVADGKRARAAYEATVKPAVDASKRAARAAGHFGHGFTREGRPKLHSGYAHFDVD